MLKVIAACGSGMGSSQIIKMKIEKVFKKLNIPVEIHHSSISEAKSLASQYNVVFCSDALKNNFSAAAEKGGKWKPRFSTRSSTRPDHPAEPSLMHEEKNAGQS